MATPTKAPPKVGLQGTYNFEGGSMPVEQYFAMLQECMGYGSGGLSGMRQSAAEVLPDAVRKSITPTRMGNYRVNEPPVDKDAPIETHLYMTEDGIKEV